MSNVVYSLIWLIVLILVGFWVAFFCAGWYIIVYPLTVCVPALSGLSDFLLVGTQFTHFCAKSMMEGKPLF